MKQPKPKRRRVPLGKVTPWTDEELERMSQVTPQDIAAAAALWHENAGRLARLLDAEEQEPDADKPANA